MKHIVAFTMKFIMALVLLEITLSLMTALTVVQILLIALAVTLVSYVMIDMLVLAFSNNIVATLCEAILAFLTIYVVSYWISHHFTAVGTAVASAVILAAAGWFFHKYTMNAFYSNRRKAHRN